MMLPRLSGISRVPYPPDHDLALHRVLRVVDIIAAEPTIDDDCVVARLMGEGVEALDAELLIRFVPCAMSFGLLKRLGVAKFPSTYGLQTASGRWVEMPLALEHYFTAALQVGFEVVNHGYNERVDQDAFQAVISRSAEMNAANQALGSGDQASLRGAVLSPPVLLGLTWERVVAGRPSRRRWWRFWR